MPWEGQGSLTRVLAELVLAVVAGVRDVNPDRIQRHPPCKIDTHCVHTAYLTGRGVGIDTHGVGTAYLPRRGGVCVCVCVCAIRTSQP